MFIFENCAIKLRKGNFIAVDVSWISPWKEHEWIALPCVFDDIKINQGDLSYVTIKQYHARQLDHFTINLQLNNEPLLNYFGNDIQALQQYQAVGLLFASAIGWFWKHKCDNCDVICTANEFNGHALDKLECPACRRYLFKVIRDENEEIECFKCKNNYKLKEFEITRTVGASCPNCRTFQKRAYIRENNGKIHKKLWRRARAAIAVSMFDQLSNLQIDRRDVHVQELKKVVQEIYDPNKQTTLSEDPKRKLEDVLHQYAPQIAQGVVKNITKLFKDK